MKVTGRIEDGDKIWRNEKGQIHRKKGPAIEYSYGNREWWQNNKRHRVGAPAIENVHCGVKLWYQNGELHRLNGPAVEHRDGYREWWIFGKQYSKEEFDKITQITIEGKSYILIPVD